LSFDRNPAFAHKCATFWDVSGNTACVHLQFEDRTFTIDAEVMEDQCLLGFIPLERLDLIVDPKQQRLVGRDPRGPTFRGYSPFPLPLD
jgi:hypothetical protein